MSSVPVPALAWRVLTLTIMQLLELENAAIGWDLSVHWVSIFDLCNQPFVMSTLRQVMRVIISVLQHEEEARNAYVYIKLFQVRQNQLLG